jgi:hypothetical protein
MAFLRGRSHDRRILQALLPGPPAAAANVRSYPSPRAAERDGLRAASAAGRSKTTPDRMPRRLAMSRRCPPGQDAGAVPLRRPRGVSPQALLERLREEYPGAALEPVSGRPNPEFREWMDALNRHLAHRQLDLNLPGCSRHRLRNARLELLAIDPGGENPVV